MKLKLNLTHWYKNNYKNFNDNILEMTVYLSKRLKSSPYVIEQKLKKVRRDRLILVAKRYKGMSDWPKFLLKQMFKRW